MINIENIGKIVGSVLKNGRTVIDAGNYTDSTRFDGSDYYKFVIDGSDNEREYGGKQTIVLSKKPGNQYNSEDTSVAGKYEMFNMGLQAATSHYLTKSEIRTPFIMLDYMAKVMDKTKSFYKNSI